MDAVDGRHRGGQLDGRQMAEPDWLAALHCFLFSDRGISVSWSSPSNATKTSQSYILIIKILLSNENGIYRVCRRLMNT